MKKLCVLLLLLPSLCKAEFLSGNDLFKKMNGDALDNLFSLGYVAGVADAHTKILTCPPKSSTVGQIHDMVKRLLEREPENRHYAADSIITNLLAEKWPCGSGKGA